MSEADFPTTTTIDPTQPVADPVIPPVKFTKDQIRAAVLDAKPKDEPLDVFGVTLYLREPPTGTILDAQNSEDKKVGLMILITNYVYDSDGNTVFDEADVDSLLSVPFGDDMRKLTSEINKFLGVQPTAADKSPTA